MALLLMNNADEVESLRVDWASVPGLGSPKRYMVYDVWQRRSLGHHSTGFVADAVASRDSIFLTLADCA